MNVTLIEMDKQQAREKLRAYRTRKHKDVEAEYAACEKAYEALAEGHPLLDLCEVIQAGGVDENGWPRLAIARADRKEVRFNWAWGHARYDGRKNPAMYDNDHYRQMINLIRWPGKHASSDSRYSLVPMVPADVRPSYGQLREWHILWEVDQWADRSNFARVSTDPLLLKHVDGDLYAVLAAWDLTPLEESILNSIRRPSR